MKPRVHDPLALDVLSLCQDGVGVAGAFAPAELPRFTQSLWSGDDAMAAGEAVRWSVAGALRARPGSAPQCLLTLTAQTQATLRCQRCLAPLSVPLKLDHRYAFVDTEEEASEADADNDDEDVLVLVRRFDLRELVEDELILAMPLVPRHDVCPQPLPAAAISADPALQTEVEPHPFAVLATLRDGGVKSDR